MNFLRKINALIAKLEPPGRPPMQAVFENGHKQPVPPDILTEAFWAYETGMQAYPEGPFVVRFECETDPRAAVQQTEFLHSMTAERGFAPVWG